MIKPRMVPGSDERYAKGVAEFGITSFAKDHVRVPSTPDRLSTSGAARIAVRRPARREELARSDRGVIALPRGQASLPLRVGRKPVCSHGPKLNGLREAYAATEFTAKDFRTWGGTLNLRP